MIRHALYLALALAASATFGLSVHGLPLYVYGVVGGILGFAAWHGAEARNAWAARRRRSRALRGVR